MNTKDSYQIRPMHAGDADFVKAILMDPSTCAYLPFTPMTEDQASTRFEEYLRYADLSFPLGAFVTELKSTLECVGYGFIRPYAWDTLHRGIEVGNIVQKSHWAQRAGSAFTHFADMRLRETQNIFAIVHNDNRASIAMISALGFQRLTAYQSDPQQTIWGLRVTSG